MQQTISQFLGLQSSRWAVLGHDRLWSGGGQVGAQVVQRGNSICHVRW